MCGKSHAVLVDEAPGLVGSKVGACRHRLLRGCLALGKQERDPVHARGCQLVLLLHRLQPRPAILIVDDLDLMGEAQRTDGGL